MMQAGGAARGVDRRHALAAMQVRRAALQGISLALMVLAVGSGCASRQRAYEKTLRSCSTSGDAGRRVERRGSVDGYGGLVSSGAGGARNEVTEIRDDCVYTVEVRHAERRWAVTGLSWVGGYVASKRGDRVAFLAQDWEGWHVVVTGAPGPASTARARGRCSPHGEHVMFVDHTDGRGGRVIVDGKEVARAPFGIDTGAYGFTSDGRYLVGIRTEDDGLRVDAGGVLGPRLDTRSKGPRSSPA